MKIKALFVATLAALTLTHSKPSHAIVGAITANPAVVTAGLVITVGGGVGYLVADNMMRRGDTGQVIMGLLVGIAAIAVAGVGIITLDGEQAMTYAPLSSTAAKNIGLTSAELSSFNAEIDQVNMLAAHVDAELASMEKATLDDSRDMWESVRDAVAPETFSALQKVTAQIYQ